MHLIRCDYSLEIEILGDGETDAALIVIVLTMMTIITKTIHEDDSNEHGICTYYNSTIYKDNLVEYHTNIKTKTTPKKRKQGTG